LLHIFNEDQLDHKPNGDGVFGTPV